MGWFIFGIIFLIAGAASAIWLYFDGEPKWGTVTLVGSLFLTVLFIVLSCLAPVATGHTGVVTTFGKVEDRTFDAGMNFKAPWNKVVELDNRVQKSTVELSCFEKNLQEVTIVYTLNYQISKTNAQDIYRNIGKDYYNIVVAPKVEEVVKEATKVYEAAELISERDTLAQTIEDALREALAIYNIKVASASLQDIDFKDEYTTAVEAKQVAKENKLRAEIEQAQKKIEAEQAAERATIQARAEAEIAQIQAQADMEVAKIASDSAEYQGRKEAAIAMQRLASINGWTVVQDENTGINTLYKADGTQVTLDELKVGSENLMKYYYIQQWNGVMPYYYVSDESVDSILLGSAPAAAVAP